ncbi:MAG: 30S ribosomal protein S18 [Chloroflexi bacterium]|nr:30S ribosomal protein S18 [Chloroflexota bacterium]
MENQDRPRRRGRGRRRPCVMCVEKMTFVDYKDFNFLRRFVSDRGRIDTRRKTGTCAKHQRALAQAIKRARHLALLPYTADHVRMGVTPFR